MNNQLMSNNQWQIIRAKALQLPDVKEGKVFYWRGKGEGSERFEISSLHIKTPYKSIITLESNGAVSFEGDVIYFLTPAKMLMFVQALLPPKET